ncbi:flavin reductase family protein [Actinomycetes bacterium NPDC127524]
MIAIDPEKISTKENYKFLIGSIIPRPIALVTTQSHDGILNIGPFSYFNIVAADPPMVSVSVQRKNGICKDTARNAMETKEFVIHIIDEDIVSDANETAAELPAGESELPRTHFSLADSDVVKVPSLKEPKIRFECVLEQAVPLGGHEEAPACDLLIGKIVRYHIADDLYQDGKIHAEKLKPVSRLAGNFYSKLGEIFEIARPE